MQSLLTLLVLVTPVAAVGYFAVLWWRQHRRLRALSRRAHGLGMSFSGEDHFDLPTRYAGFALVAGGHSPWVANVTHGKASPFTVRAFDLRIEAGHGPRRQVRPYGVMVLESSRPVGDLLLWNTRFAEDAPLGARRQDGIVGEWSFRGPAATAGELAALLSGLEGRLVCVELQDTALLGAAVPGKSDYGVELSDLAPLAQRAAAMAADRSFERGPA